MAEQGCGELETGPAAVSLRQGLMAPGADMGFWAMSRVRAFPGDWAGNARSGGALRA